MNTDAMPIFDAALNLPISVRADLAAQLIASLDKSVSPAPTQSAAYVAMALPDVERVRLADMLMDSVKPAGVLSVDDPDFEAEISRRQQEVADGTAVTYSIEETMAAVRQALAEQRKT